MKTSSRILLVMVALLLPVAAMAARTSSSPDLDMTPNPGWVMERGNGVLLIETGLPVTGTISRALNELGHPHDYFIGEDFSGINLSPYAHVFVGLDGGAILEPSIINIRNFVQNGGCLHIYGGTCWDAYAIALNTHLLQNNLQDFCWQTVFGTPHATVTNPGHYLATGLPATYNFLDISATYYATKITDPAGVLAARNGDNRALLASKTIGAGNLDICVNSPADFYYTNNTDYQWLKQVVANMLLCGAATAVEPTTWGSIKSLYE